MQTRRWNWLVLGVLGAVAVFVGVAGLVVGAFESSAEPIVFLVLGGGLIIAGLAMRRAYRRYESEAMTIAGDDLDPDGHPLS